MPVQMYWSPSEIGNLSAGPQNILKFKVSLRRRDNHEVNLRRSHRSVSKYNQSSPRACPSSSQVQRTLVLCKERTLRDSFKIAVVTNTRPERSAIKSTCNPKKVLQLSSEGKARKTRKSRHLQGFACKGCQIEAPSQHVHYSSTVKPALNDHRFKRPPAFSDRFFMHGESAIQSALC